MMYWKEETCGMEVLGPRENRSIHESIPCPSEKNSLWNFQSLISILDSDFCGLDGHQEQKQCGDCSIIATQFQFAYKMWQIVTSVKQVWLFNQGEWMCIVSTAPRLSVTPSFVSKYACVQMCCCLQEHGLLHRTKLFCAFSGFLCRLAKTSL